MSPTRTRFGAVGAGWPSKRLDAQAVLGQHATDAPVAHLMALGLHFHPQPAGAVALAMIRKRFAHHDLPSRRGR